MSDAVTHLNAALEGRYTIERELGEGGMATVYLADDLKHERKVALKVLKPDLAAVVGAERFLAEIRTTANLQHPHILPLFDSGEADGFLFYVMPFVEGESLRDRLDREHQLPVDEAVKIMKSIIKALVDALPQVNAVRALTAMTATETLPSLRRLDRRASGVLDRLTRPPHFLDSEFRVVLRQAIAQLEDLLPRPAEAVAPGVETLPRTATEPGPDRGTLPRAAEVGEDGE